MAHKKAAGSTKNGRDSNPKYLGIKVNNGEKAIPGNILLRQRGTEYLPGRNVKMGKDHTIFAIKEGVVSYGKKRKIRFDNSIQIKKIVHIS
jgi:large subunit ribosomal protein L27